MSEREPYNGRPFYCDTCGSGFGEFMACDGIDCKLESEEKAQARRDTHAASQANRSVEQGRK